MEQFLGPLGLRAFIRFNEITNDSSKLNVPRDIHFHFYYSLIFVLVKQYYEKDPCVRFLLQCLNNGGLKNTEYSVVTRKSKDHLMCHAIFFLHFFLTPSPSHVFHSGLYLRSQIQTSG